MSNQEELKSHHLIMLLEINKWSPAYNQANMPALHPVTLTDLFEHRLIERKPNHQIILTTAGKNVVENTVYAMNYIRREGAAGHYP